MKCYILFIENPVLCDENLPQLVGMFEMYHARLMGIAHCIVPQLLPIPTDSQSNLLQSPPMELLASIMNPNQQIPLGSNQMPMLQPPSIVQIIVPAHSLPHITLGDKTNLTENETTLTIATTSSNDEASNDTYTTDTPSELLSTVQPLRSSIPVSQQTSTTTILPDSDSEDDIDDIQFKGSNDDDFHDENETKQRDLSDFRYIETFESEKAPIFAMFEDADPIENDSEMKNVIHENFSQIPHVMALPIPKALSSSKDSTKNDEPPEDILQDQNLNMSDLYN